MEFTFLHNSDIISRILDLSAKQAGRRYTYACFYRLITLYPSSKRAQVQEFVFFQEKPVKINGIVDIHILKMNRMNVNKYNQVETPI